ncbi:MAG: hypothetical protein JRF64_04005 [Deltaproteobacteria bacterium]|nr:hypothetical protein [Deltaproteobacteria bacterium]
MTIVESLPDEIITLYLGKAILIGITGHLGYARVNFGRGPEHYDEYH